MVNQGVYSQRRFYRLTGYKTADGMLFPGSPNVWFVDSNKTSAVTGSGYNWDDAFLTIAEAVSAASAQDTILIKGTDNADSDSNPVNDYSESVTIPATKPGLKIIGMGAGPEGVKWTVGTAEGIILTINAIDCVVENIRFRPNGATSGSAIWLAKNAALTENANGAQIRNCIFRSTTETALAGIHTEGANDVVIENNVFTSVATAVLQSTTPNSVSYRMIVKNNFVDDKCTNGFVIDGRSCLFDSNQFAGAGLTMILDTTASSGTGSYNVIRNHIFKVTAYETNCTGCATDDWWFNYCDDTESSTVSAAYLTIGIPTA